MRELILEHFVTAYQHLPAVGIRTARGCSKCSELYTSMLAAPAVIKAIYRLNASSQPRLSGRRTNFNIFKLLGCSANVEKSNRHNNRNTNIINYSSSPSMCCLTCSGWRMKQETSTGMCSKNLMKCNHLENPANTFIVIASCNRATTMALGELRKWALVSVSASTYICCHFETLLSAFLPICSFNFARSSNLYSSFHGHIFPFSDHFKCSLNS